MNVPFANLRATYERLAPELDAAATRVLSSGNLIGGPEVEAFENAFADFAGSRYATGVANGTDAIALGLRAVGVRPGDQVIVPAVSAYPTCVGVVQSGAEPLFADVDAQSGLIDLKSIEGLVSPRTRALVPVHLYGNACDMDGIAAFAQDHDLLMLEDCAQAHGTQYKQRAAGRWSLAAAWSFYPTKNLGAFGDAGAVTTDSDEIVAKLRRLRNYGQRNRYEHTDEGFNSRMDPLQAALLTVRLRHLVEDNSRRREIASRYDQAFSSTPGLRPLTRRADSTSSNHLYPILLPTQAARSQAQELLRSSGIETLVHYPIPMPEQPATRPEWRGARSFPGASSFCSRVLSLPIYPELSDAQVSAVIAAALAVAGQA